MLDEKIEKAIKPLTEMYENIENDLLIEIAKHFIISQEFENSDAYRIQKLMEMGSFNEDVINYLARYTNKTPLEIRIGDQLTIQELDNFKYGLKGENI